MDDVYGLSDIKLANIFSKVLLKFKICDNACGSGAFLLASANTLYEIYNKINANSGMRNTEIGLKKLILINNLYGVDLNPNAIEIAKLRLWLWLVDAYKPNTTPEALPNIDYHLKSGNSLIGITNLESFFKKSLKLEDYFTGKPLKVLLLEKKKLIDDYQHKTGSEARLLKKQIEKLADPIRDSLSKELYNTISSKIDCTYEDFLNLSPFHWGFEFSEVFEDGGFDVIVGNPPYIQLQKMSKSADIVTKNSKLFYENADYKVYSKSGDIYCLFYERSNQLLRAGGILSYITSNKWMRNEYGQPLRDFFIKNVHMRHIIDIADLQVFKTATVECGILSFEAQKNQLILNKTTFSSCIISNDSDLANIEEYCSNNSSDKTFELGSPWSINTSIYDSIESKMKQYGVPLKEWDVSIMFGIKTGFNEAYIIDSNTRNVLIAEDPKSAEIIMPVLRGKDIQRYTYKFNDKYTICVKYGQYKTLSEEFPAIYNHLKKYEVDLKKRGQCRYTSSGKVNKGDYPGQHHWLELDNNPSEEYFDLMHSPKIMWGEISDHTKFSIDIAGVYCVDATCFFMTGKDLYYLLAILNSKLSEYAFSHIGTTTGMGTTRWKKYKIELLQVAKPDKTLKEAITNKAIELIEKRKKGEEVSSIESEIDNLVYRLYQLNDEEISEIETSIASN